MSNYFVSQPGKKKSLHSPFVRHLMCLHQQHKSACFPVRESRPELRHSNGRGSKPFQLCLIHSFQSTFSRVRFGCSQHPLFPLFFFWIFGANQKNITDSKELVPCLGGHPGGVLTGPENSRGLDEEPPWKFRHARHPRPPRIGHGPRE